MVAAETSLTVVFTQVDTDCMFDDQYKGFMDLRSSRSDQDPRFAVHNILMAPVLLSVFLVSWLGGTWLTLAAYTTTVLAIVGSWLYLRPVDAVDKTNAGPPYARRTVEHRGRKIPEKFETA